MKVSLIIFDLDGTLVDSKYDLTTAVNLTRKHYRLDSLDANEVASYLGNGISALVNNILPMVQKEEIASAIIQFKIFYFEHLLDTTKPYSGVIEMLESLKDIKKVVLSNKNVIFAKRIISKLELKKYFDDIYGGDSFSEKKPSAQPVCKIIKSFSLAKENVVIVGDGVNDILSGKNAGITTISTLYGYSSKEEIEEVQPTFIAQTPGDVVNILKGLK